MNLAVRYMSMYRTVPEAAAAMAVDLMRGDPATFKAGYSRDNALLVVIEQFEFSEVERDALIGEIIEHIEKQKELV